MAPERGIDSQFPVSVWDVVMMGRYGAMNLLRIPERAIVCGPRCPEAGELFDSLKADRALSGRAQRAFLARDRAACRCAAAG